MKLHSCIFCTCLLTVLLASCGNGQPAPSVLAKADSLMEQHPDSALKLLQGAKPDIASWNEECRMKHALLLSQAEDKNKIKRTNDSTMQSVAQYFDRHGDSRWRALAWFELGRISSDMQLTGEAINAYKRAFDVDTLSQDSAVLTLRAKAAIWIGHTLMYQDIYAPAMSYFVKAKKLADRSGDRRTQAFTLRDIARSYVAQGKLKEGELFFLRASQAALANHDIDIYKSMLVELSDLYYSTEEYPKMKTALDACSGIGNSDSCIVVNQLANYYSAVGNADSAAMLFRRELQAGDPFVRRDATLNLAALTAQQGDFKEAYRLLDKSISEDDSLTAVEQGQNANLIKTLNDKLEKEKMQDNRVRRQMNIIYSLALIIVCLILFTYFSIRHKNLQSRIQREKAERLMSELRRAEQTKRPWRNQNIRTFTESEIYESFHNPNFLPRLQDYHTLEDALNATYDDCITKIRQLHENLKDKELHLCMLEKAEVSNKLICADLGMEPNALSMLRARLYTKLFHCKGSADMFHEFLKTL